MWNALRATLLAAGACCIVFVAGCTRSTATDAPTQGSKSLSRADASDLRDAIHPDYKTPAGTRQECIGRLIFDVPLSFEWGITKPNYNSSRHGFGFDGKVYAGNESVNVGDVEVMVLGPVPKTEIQRMLEHHDAVKGNAIRNMQDELKVDRRVVGNLRAIQKQPDHPENKDPSGLQAAIERHETNIRDLEQRIQAYGNGSHPFDLGLPDSAGYKNGSSLYAYIWRHQRLYILSEHPYTEDTRTREQRRAIFDRAVKNFRPRKPYEIPKERGLCFAYGFIADDGTEPFRVKNSIRFTDTRGVIYSIGTETVGKLGSEATLINAIGRAAAVLPDGATGAEAAEKISRRIGPRQVKIGALTAEQGGVALTLKSPKQPPLETYSVYTGFGGYGGSQVLPIITVEMRSFTREQEPTLKRNPPPLDASMTRLDALLKSIRLRPTEPPMSELVNLSTSP